MCPEPRIQPRPQPNEPSGQISQIILQSRAPEPESNTNMHLVKQQEGQAKSWAVSTLTEGVSPRTSSLGRSSVVYDLKESSEHM